MGTFNRDADILGASGFDVPTLLGLHATAPYLHDGSARTLVEVLDNPRHTGGALDEAQKAELAAFMAGLDERAFPFPP